MAHMVGNYGDVASLFPLFVDMANKPEFQLGQAAQVIVYSKRGSTCEENKVYAEQIDEIAQPIRTKYEKKDIRIAINQDFGMMVLLICVNSFQPAGRAVTLNAPIEDTQTELFRM